MELRDSRRLTGPNLFWDRPGAIIDVALNQQEFADPARFEPICLAWENEARRLLDAVGWSAERTTRQCFPVPDGSGHLSLAISAPLDGLYAATEINEWAFQVAVAQAAGQDPAARDEAITRLIAEVSEEANPSLIELRREAIRRGLCFLSDDELVSVGMGQGSMTWGVTEIPEIAAMPWPRLHNIPHVLVTGTNGKSTAVRLLAAMAAAAGRIAGTSSTDWIRIGEELIDAGDWSGPGGARQVLRDSRVDLALLETARGGMIRRGLALERTQLAVILNVGADHLGEWGAHSLEDIAASKFIVASVTDHVLLNADDQLVVKTADARLDDSCPRSYFGLDPEAPVLAEHLESKRHAAYLRGDTMMLHPIPAADKPRGGRAGTDAEISVLPVADAPMTLGGAARYNIANALAAIAAGDLLGLPLAAIREGLRRFGHQSADNPGRLNLFELSGVQAIVDFAHNSHGLLALFATANALPATRRAVLLGQAGDRGDEAVREMTRLVWQAGPDLVVIKEQTEHLRGRQLGEIPAIIEAELRAAGAGDGAFCHAPDELSAVRTALEWAQPGDLLLLLSHDFRDQVLDLVTRLRDSGWQPGITLPD